MGPAVFPLSLFSTFFFFFLFFFFLDIYVEAIVGKVIVTSI